MPSIIRVQIASYGYQICRAVDARTGQPCDGAGCAKCHGLGEVPAVSGVRELAPAVGAGRRPKAGASSRTPNPAALATVRRIVNKAKKGNR